MLDAATLKERLIAANIAAPSNICGCSPEEIKKIGDVIGLPLPKAYVDFLRAFGRGAGSFMRDIDVYYPRVLELRGQAREILENWEEGRLPLPVNALVFAMRQGEQFMFVIADGVCDDPPVWYYVEEAGGFKEIGRSIWGIFESELSVSEDFRRRYPDSPFLKDSEGKRGQNYFS